MKRILCMTVAAAAVLAFGCPAKDGYKVSEQTPANFITWQSGPGDDVVHSGEDCAMPAPFDGTAYQYLQALIKAGDRRSGTKQVRCGELFIRDTLASFGYKVEELEYSFPYYQFDADAVKIVRDRDGKQFEAYPSHYSMAVAGSRTGKLKRPFGELTGCFVYVDDSLLSHGDIKEKYKKWREKGALGFVKEGNLRPLAAKGMIHSSRAHATSYYYAPLPGFIVDSAKELLGETITIYQDARIVNGHGFDVIARGPDTQAPDVVITAHLDSWFEGALDDGSGVAVLLEAARLLKDDSHDLVFLAVDSEEIGLIGSAAYVNRFGLDNVAALFELDMVSNVNNYFHRDSPEGAGIMPRIISVTHGMKPVTKKPLRTMEGTNIIVSVGLNNALFGGLATDMEWFYSGGVPGVFIYTPSYYYHTKKDTIEWIPEGDIQEVALASSALAKDLREKAEGLPAPTAIVPIDFNAALGDGDSIEFEVRLPDGGPAWGTDVTVICYYRFGFEKKVELERDKDGVWKGEFVPPRPGPWQFLAVVDKGRKHGKRWSELYLPEFHPTAK